MASAYDMSALAKSMASAYDMSALAMSMASVGKFAAGVLASVQVDKLAKSDPFAGVAQSIARVGRQGRAQPNMPDVLQKGSPAGTGDLRFDSMSPSDVTPDLEKAYGPLDLRRIRTWVLLGSVLDFMMFYRGWNQGAVDALCAAFIMSVLLSPFL